MILSQLLKLATVLQPAADRFNTNPASLCVSFEHYSHATFVLMVGSVAGTGVAKVQVEKCTAADGTGATAIDFKYRKATSGDTLGDLISVLAANGFTTDATADDIYIIEVDGRQLGEGYAFARIKLTETVDDPKSAAILAIMGGAAYKGADMPTCLA